MGHPLCQSSVLCISIFFSYLNSIDILLPNFTFKRNLELTEEKKTDSLKLQHVSGKYGIQMYV